MDVEGACEEESGQSENPTEAGTALREVCCRRDERRDGDDPPQRGAPQVDSGDDAEGIEQGRPEHGLAWGFEMERGRRSRSGKCVHKTRSRHRGRDAPGTAGRACPERSRRDAGAIGASFVPADSRRRLSPHQACGPPNGCLGRSLSAPGARRFPGGRFAETNPPGALARRDNRRRAGARDRGPAWPDRTIHK